MRRESWATYPPITIVEYFQQAETNRRQELVWGVVREPPSPFYDHQSVVLTIATLLRQHVHGKELGKVIVSPFDVVLDARRALIVQPDALVILNERLHILQKHCWGPPDLVVEVLSPSTARRDRTTKVGWYRRYGVRECWLGDYERRTLEVIDLANPRSRPTRFIGNAAIESRVLPVIGVTAGALLS
jgi:Uma2 family endonuclease